MKHSVAHHEAGHAVACLVHGIKFKHVSIIKDLERNSLGHIQFKKLKLGSEYNNSDRARLKAEKFISICLAGPLAESKFLKKPNNIGAAQDYDISFQIASNMFGHSKVVNAFIDFILLDTEGLFTYQDENEDEGSETEYQTEIWKDLLKLAELLSERKKLSYKEVLELLPHY